MIQAPNFLSPRALVAVGPRSDYFASDTHYKSLAHRIAAALSGGGRFVLVTGPPANPQVFSDTLGQVIGPCYAMIDIPCGPELRGEDLERAVPMLAGPRASGDAAMEPQSSVSAPPLFVFHDFDRLSDRQIEDVCEGTLHGDQRRAAGVLLAPLGFLARLERPALRFLKEHLAAQFRVQEVGDDEAITFLHHQLLAQRDRLSEARGFRRGILIGLAGCGVVLAASTGAFLILHATPEQVRTPPASAGESSPPSDSDKVLVLGPTEEVTTVASPAQPAAKTETIAALTAASPPLPVPLLPPAEGESPGRVDRPAAADPPPAPRLSASDIAVLLVRGDGFLSTGDVTSARLFYERAADAGDGLAALQLGATFDPVMLSRAGLRGVSADPAQALSWYQRAREFGAGGAEQRIKALQIRRSN